MKKATRRIKDAKRVVQEFLPANSELGTHNYIDHQINLLCHKIRRIPLLLKNNESKNKYNIAIDKSIGSDSDSFGDQKVSPQSKVRRGKRDMSKGKKKNSGHTDTLNGVEIFSSDSDILKEDIVTGQYIPIQVKGRNPKSPDNYDTEESLYAVIGEDSQHNTEYLMPVDLRTDLREQRSQERTRWRQGITSSSTPERNNAPFSAYSEEIDHERKHTNTKSLNTNSDIKYIMTRKPLPVPRKERVEEATIKNSSGTAANENSKADLLAYSYVKAKSLPKRLLPSVPKSGGGYSRPIEHSCRDTSKYGLVSEHFNGKVDRSDIDTVDLAKFPHSNNTTNEDEIRDIEEMEFKESVQTCRQNIMDRIKERYTLNSSFRRTPSPDILVGNFKPNHCFDIDHLDSYASISDDGVRRKSDLDLKQVGKMSDHLSRSLGSSENRQGSTGNILDNTNIKDDNFATMNDRIKSPNTHWSKLVFVDRYSPKSKNSQAESVSKAKEQAIETAYTVNNVTTSNQSMSDSLVSKGIMKFESSVQDNLSSNRYPVPKGFQLKKSPMRPRSISAEGVPLKTTRYRYRSTSSLYALAPRSREPIISSENSPDTLGFRHLGSVESDLDKLCNESKRSIRQEWSQRRSQSLQSTPKTPEKTTKGPSFEYHSSFSIPGHDKSERCHISSIVTMPDGQIVVLDQRHRHLYTFDRHHTFRAQCSISEFPGGMVTLAEDKIAIAYPYKSKSGVYCIETEGDIHFQRDIVSPCSQWVNGIGFAKGHLYLLCKGGDVHVITTENTEVRTISVGMNGKILVHPNGRRFYIIGEGRITKFDAEGTMLSSTEHVGAYSLILLNDNLYAIDRQKHMITSVRFGLSEEHDLIGRAVEYPSAVSASATGEQLLVSQFEEGIDILKTRTIHVYKLQTKLCFL